MNAPVSPNAKSPSSNAPEPTPAVKLPLPMMVTTFDGLQGRLLLRPWYDWVGVRAVVNWYFPLSRAWASALEADGDLLRYNDLLGRSFASSKWLDSALDQTCQADRAYQKAQQRWNALYFDDEAASDEELVSAEVTRQRASKTRMMCRKAFLPWRLRLPKLRWSIPGPDEVSDRHEARFRSESAAFKVPDDPVFEVSRKVQGDWGHNAVYRQHWLRFPSLSADVPGSESDERAWAKVYEPEGGADGAPCLIFLHGIGMETDFWGEMTDPVNMMTRKGFRVIRPEAPWHGHRRTKGFFGGEPAIAQGPMGFIELFHASVREVAQMIEWARRTGAPRVAVGGLSLGALTAQIVATQSRNWSEAQRPNDLLLVTTSEDMLDIALRGSMARLLEMPRRFAEAGWSEAELSRWTPLLEPHGDPVMPADRIAVLLGNADDLTPVKGGESLLRRWNVPENNVFRRNQGHFSASLGLYRDSAVLERLAAIMTG